MLVHQMSETQQLGAGVWMENGSSASYRSVVCILREACFESLCVLCVTKLDGHYWMFIAWILTYKTKQVIVCGATHYFSSRRREMARRVCSWDDVILFILPSIVRLHTNQRMRFFFSIFIRICACWWLLLLEKYHRKERLVPSVEFDVHAGRS